MVNVFASKKKIIKYKQKTHRNKKCAEHHYGWINGSIRINFWKVFKNLILIHSTLYPSI